MSGGFDFRGRSLTARPPLSTSVEMGGVVIERDGHSVRVEYEELPRLIHGLDRHRDALSDARDA